MSSWHLVDYTTEKIQHIKYTRVTKSMHLTKFVTQFITSQSLDVSKIREKMRKKMLVIYTLFIIDNQKFIYLAYHSRLLIRKSSYELRHYSS